MSAEVVGFERVKEEYEACPDFGEIVYVLKEGATLEIDDFLLHDGYSFRFCKLCIPSTSLRDYLIWELHTEGLVGHYDREKTIEVVESLFYWPSL